MPPLRTTKWHQQEISSGLDIIRAESVLRRQPALFRAKPASIEGWSAGRKNAKGA